MYEFDVKAHTENAEGPYSAVVQCSTLEGRKYLSVTEQMYLQKDCKVTNLHCYCCGLFLVCK